MKVVVTGGTGFVGREVVGQLRAAGHDVRLLTRKETTAGKAACIPVMQGCAAVLHLVGIISEVGDQTFENVHTRLTELIVDSARTAGLKRFVQMSALGTRANARSRYHQTKWAAEEIVRGSGLDWTIFRPSIIYGPGDGFVNLFARMASFSPVIPLIGGGRTRFQPIPVADVAKCFVGALAEPQSIRHSFDLCGGQTLSLAVIVETILKVKNCRRLKLPWPFALAQIQAAITEFIFRGLLGKASPLNRDQVLMLREDNVGQGGPAADLFGLSFAPNDFETGIARYLRKESPGSTKAA